MVKNVDSDAVWLKIKQTNEILDTTSPSKISCAILGGRNPPDRTFEALKRRVKRLLKKQDDIRNISPKRSPDSGRPRTVTTPKNLGRIKKAVRWRDTKSLLKAESIGEVYPSYSNGYVCRPSRQNGAHDSFDRRKQAVKMADVFGIEKMWAAIYKGADNMGILVSRKVIGHRIFLGRLDT